MTVHNSFLDFLKALRAHESGVDPDKFDTYNDPNQTVQYFKTDKLGEPVRADDGNFVLVTLKYDEYFNVLGVTDQWEKSKKASDLTDRQKWLEEMQYASVNFLGFVGYQVGEAALIETGYYVAEQALCNTSHKMAPRYYVYTDNSNFAHDKKEIDFRWSSDSQWFIATDHNRWNGTFTGKNKVNSFDNLRHKDAQEFIVRDVLTNNYMTIVNTLGSSARTALSDCYDKGVSWEHKSGKYEIIQPATLSGLLAASWLAGAAATVKIVKDRKVPYRVGDETGTSPGDYIKRFSGYPTMLDDGKQEKFKADQYTSDIVVGWPKKTYIDLSAAASTRLKVTLHDNRPSEITFDSFVCPDGHTISYFQVPKDYRPTIDVDHISGGNVKIQGTKYSYTPTPDPDQTPAQVLTFVNWNTMTEDEFRKKLKPALPGLHVYELYWWRQDPAKPCFLPVNDFDPSTAVFQPSAKVTYISFSDMALVQAGNDTTLYVVGQTGESGFGYTLTGITKGQLTSANFSGIHGSFSEIRPDKPTIGQGCQG